jgi:hypothetical protein
MRGFKLVAPVAGVAIAAGLGLVGCSSDGGDDTAAVDVTLSEWIVEPSPKSAPAGDIEFTGDNVGSETHELVLVKADSAKDLPTDADGAVVEDELPGDGVLDELEDIETQTTKKMTVALDPGRYVLFCNVTEDLPDGTVESHFAEGMHGVVTVEE